MFRVMLYLIDCNLQDMGVWVTVNSTMLRHDDFKIKKN